MVEKEYADYALSQSKGWIRIATKYYREEEEKDNDKPSDTVIVKRFHSDLDTIAGVKHWDEIIEGTESQASSFYMKYGDAPDQPYI